MGKAAGEPGLIKRYDNRKLYDPAARRYVTIDALARRVADGEELRVVEQSTGEDITTQLLAQVVVELIRQRTAQVPREVLARLIRFGMGPAPVAEPPTPQDLASRARDEAERVVGGLVKKGRITLEEALSVRQELGDSLQRLASETQRRLEGHVHGLLELSERESGVSPALAALRRRLLALETHLPGDEAGELKMPPPAKKKGTPPSGARKRSRKARPRSR